MNTSEQINELASALSLAQGKIEPAKMNAVNPFLKNKYADLGAIIDAIKPHLAANGLSFIQLPTAPSELFPGVGLVTRLMHSSGQWVEESFYMPISEGKGINAAQQYGVALTYARRYALASLFGIVADGDTDGATDKPAGTTATTPPPVKQPQQTAPSVTDEQRKPSEAMLKKLWASGNALYGKEWETKRVELVTSVTKGRTDSNKHLTFDECKKLIDGIDKLANAPLFYEEGGEEH